MQSFKNTGNNTNKLFTYLDRSNDENIFLNMEVLYDIILPSRIVPSVNLSGGILLFSSIETIKFLLSDKEFI